MDKKYPYYELKIVLSIKKITLYDIANLLNCSIPTVSKKLNGQSEFSFIEVEMICDHYGISPECFRTLKRIA